MLTRDCWAISSQSHNILFMHLYFLSWGRTRCVRSKQCYGQWNVTWSYEIPGCPTFSHMTLAHFIPWPRQFLQKSVCGNVCFLHGRFVTRFQVFDISIHQKYMSWNESKNPWGKTHFRTWCVAGTRRYLIFIALTSRTLVLSTICWYNNR